MTRNIKMRLLLITLISVAAASSLSVEGQCDDQICQPSQEYISYILIRHAYSQFNHLKQQTVSAFGKESP